MFSEQGDKITLTMSRSDYKQVLMLLGAATSSGLFYPERILALVNRLNEGNPNYRPYEGLVQPAAPGSVEILPEKLWEQYDEAVDKAHSRC